MNTNIIQAQKFYQIRILFGAPLLIEFEYKYSDNLNNTEYLIWIQKPSKKYQNLEHRKLHTGSSVLFQLQQKLWNLFCSVSKLQPNTKNVRFWKITRIPIWILFSFEKSPKYKYKFGLRLSFEYKYHYSVSTIWILFKYQSMRSPLSSPEF